jgi:NADP-dependent 3-hydroxy acid dehydrogenase YdfG
MGRLDIVVANAGILPMAFGKEFDPMHFVDATDVDLLGVMNTVAVALPPPAHRRIGHHHRVRPRA